MNKISVFFETIIGLTISSAVFFCWLIFPRRIHNLLGRGLSRLGFLARSAPTILLGCLLVGGCAGPVKYISSNGTEVETSEEVARMMAIRDMEADRAKNLKDALIAAKDDPTTIVAIMALAMRPQQTIERGRDWAEKVGSLSGIFHDAIGLTFLLTGGDLFGDRTDTRSSQTLTAGRDIYFESDGNSNNKQDFTLSNGEGSLNLDAGYSYNAPYLYQDNDTTTHTQNDSPQNKEFSLL